MSSVKLGFALAIVTGCGNVSSNTDAAVQHDARSIDAPAVDGAPAPCDLTKPFGTPKNLVEISTPSAEASISLSPDELTAYVSTQGGPSPQGSYDLYIATRTSTADMFGALSPMTALNTSLAEESGVATADGLQLFYYEDAAGGGDIYTATRSSMAASFGAGSPVAVINAPNVYDAAPYLLGDGLTMYFSSYRAANTNYDLYKTTRASLTGTFTAPVAISELNTTNFSEDSPVLSPDGLTLFFSGTATTGSTGGADIWVAKRASASDPFGTPVNVGELNSAVDDWPTHISADGCRLYFGSDRGGGEGSHDLYVATRPK